MVKVQLPKPHAQMIEQAQGVQFVVPIKRNVFLLLFLGAWLIGWCFGEVLAVREVLRGRGDLSLLSWLVMWTLGGGLAIYIWLWMLTGKELIQLKPDSLVIKKDLLGFGPIREYDLTHLRNLRVAPASYGPFDRGAGMSFGGLRLSGGPIAFDYGEKTFRFGAALDEAEASKIVHVFKSRHAFDSD